MNQTSRGFAVHPEHIDHLTQGFAVHPGGMHENSPTFQRWVKPIKSNQVPKGRLKLRATSAVPSELVPVRHHYPTLKRWAITGRPSGTMAPRRNPGQIGLIDPHSVHPRSGLINSRIFGSFLVSALILTGCSFAPKYDRPTVQTPANFKELTPDATNVWKVAQPADAVLRGKWWEMFNDAELNALEEQVAISNQNVAAAFANFLSARAIVKETRAQLFPTLTVSPDVTHGKLSLQGQNGSSTSAVITRYSFPLDATWQLDLWGRVRNAVKANSYEAQATTADLENTRLTAQAELAADYFQLRAQDALKQLYDETVKAYRESLELTTVRFQTGIASDEDVAQAETQLETAEAQATNLELLRAQLEHAIALLMGQPASNFSLPVEALSAHPPPTPFGIPSQLLQRRPDIAAAERRVAEANAQIGVAKAAYYPTVTLSASAGLASTSFGSLFGWSSRVWSVGAGLAETIFDAGQRRATVEQFRAEYDATVARYRETVLTAFQQVEDNLAALRILARQIEQQETAVKSANRYVTLANDRYKLGIDSYLNVILAQTTYLLNRQNLVNLRSQQMSASVQLVEAIGGGWDVTQMPSPKQLYSKTP